MGAGRSWSGSIGWRLLAAFLAVGVGPVVLLALAAGISVDHNTASLLAEQRTQLRNQIAAALGAAYTAGRGSWQTSQLDGVQALATTHGIGVVVLDHSGHQVATVGPEHHGDEHSPSGTSSQAPSAGTPGRQSATPVPNGPATHSPGHDTRHQPAAPSSTAPDHHPDEGLATPWGTEAARLATSNDPPDGAPARTAASIAPVARLIAAGTTTPAANSDTQPVTVPIVVNGTQVGTARLTLPATTDSPVTAARAALLRSMGVAAALAVLLAAVAAIVVSRRVSRPLVALAAATRSFAAGEPNPERLLRPAPGELGEVGRAFTAMAATLRREDELRRTVTADVAHELRTPVTILRGQTEQLLDGIAEPTPAFLVSLHDEVLRLERVTEDLATLSAADAAGLSLRTGPVDLGRIAAHAVEAMAAQFGDADLHLRLDTDDAVVVDADATRLTQVTTNLLTNAVKFTPPGGTITVKVSRTGPDAVLTVADTGPGIDPDELPHVFDRFWRGRAARTRSGTGIGLAVVHALVTAHGGTVTAGTTTEGGALFSVRLPTAPSPDRLG